MDCKFRGPLHAKGGGSRPDIYHCNGGMKFCTLQESDRKLLDGSIIPHCHSGCPTLQKTPAPPAESIGPLTEYFDRATIINLKRRPDRLEQIKAEISKSWPFTEPVILDAIDGQKCKAPIGYTQGDYAWACLQSHRRSVEDAIMAGAESLIVLEDDAVFVDGFPQKAEEFLKNVPDDWELLFFGGRSEGPTVVAPGVAKIVHIDRTHAYAARGRGLLDLYNHWHQWHAVHCDWAISRWVANYKAYCAVPWLVGQRGGFSDIQFTQKNQEWWHHGPLPSAQPAPQLVGTEVHKILSSIGIHASSCGACQDMINKMNQWGVVGCLQHKDEIIARLRERAATASWLTKINAARLSVQTGLAAEVNWLDPAPGIFQKAIDLCANRA